MAETGVPCRSILMAGAASLMLACGGVRASEEAVDRATQTALSLDAHPDRGAPQFGGHCAGCHGARAQGDPERAIPALAGQRFAYLVRQLANFSGAERDSDTMHRVASQTELREPQTWVDVAAYLNRASLSSRTQTGDGTRLALGRGIFHERCAGCHRGDDRRATADYLSRLRGPGAVHKIMRDNGVVID